jgi:transcriptional regulator with XRE-family HTH domain
MVSSPPTDEPNAIPGTARANSSINASVGRTIRELRDLKQFTARDLASKAGVSAAMISRIESGQVSPSLSMLEGLSAALEVPIVSLFRDTGSTVADFTHVRRGEGLKSRRLMGQHSHDFAMLGFHRRLDLQFEALMVTIERTENTSPPTYTGHGCLFVYLIEGAAIYRYGTSLIELGEGDSLCLDAELR